MARRKRRASFRGVRFNLTDTDSSFGRRGILHQFPFRDEPYTEDLGRKPREYEIEAFVTGFDYARERDKLIEACEKPGPARLVHPYLGKTTVVCIRCELSESSTEGNVARFRLGFREAGVLKYPSSARKPGGLFAALGIELSNEAIANFEKVVEIAEKPQYVIDEAIAKVQEVGDAITEATRFVTATADGIAELAYSIEELTADVQDVIDTPAVLAARIQNSIGLLGETASSARLSFDAYKGMFGFGDTDTRIINDAATRLQANKNLDEINALVRRSALIGAGQAALEIEYASTDEARDAASALYAEIDAQLETDGITDTAYALLQQLRATLHDGLPIQDEKLPSLVDVIVRDPSNALVISYDLYGDLSGEADIVARNRLTDPGFIKGGTTIQVLSNVNE